MPAAVLAASMRAAYRGAKKKNTRLPGMVSPSDLTAQLPQATPTILNMCFLIAGRTCLTKDAKGFWVSTVTIPEYGAGISAMAGMAKKRNRERLARTDFMKIPPSDENTCPFIIGRRRGEGQVNNA